MANAPHFLSTLIGLRGDTDVPNIADGSSVTSTAISRHMLDALGLGDNGGMPKAQTAGKMMETLVADDLRAALKRRDPEREWLVDRPGRKVSRFVQYEHLATLQRLIDNDETGVLRMAVGRDYEVAPDITVGVLRDDLDGNPEGLPLLHASVSCKLTIRSDRVQNIRQESAVLTRQRRGRLPHIVAVTMEPLPTRLASIARGTGDVDAVYHPAFRELHMAVEEAGTAEQRDALEEIVGQRRLLDYATLANTLAVS